MYEKLRRGEDLFCEHELLEILLYNARPRINTNPLAHALVARFGSLDGVLNASMEELESVDGIGESTAAYLKCFALLVDRSSKMPRSIPTSFSPGTFRKFLAERYAQLAYEVLDLYFLDAKSNIVGCSRFTTREPRRVIVDSHELSRCLGEQHPYGLIVVHNHTGRSPQPSAADDELTCQCQILCSLNNIRFYDHFICADSELYSYSASGRLQEISEKYNIKALLEK